MSTADYFIEKGKEEKSIEFVKNLLQSGRFTITEIASLAGVAEVFVLKIKGTMQ